jgi:hypothetical protein
MFNVTDSKIVQLWEALANGDSEPMRQCRLRAILSRSAYSANGSAAPELPFGMLRRRWPRSRRWATLIAVPPSGTRLRVARSPVWRSIQGELGAPRAFDQQLL